MQYEHQDWEPVVIRVRDSQAGGANIVGKHLVGNKALCSAIRNGATVATTAKAGNKAHDVDISTRLKKLDNETENFHHNHASFSLRNAIKKARIEKELTQADLAQKINQKTNVVQSYESGAAIPTPEILKKMSLVLGVNLNAIQKKALTKSSNQAG